jgi:hypothetical protein
MRYIKKQIANERLFKSSINNKGLNTPLKRHYLSNPEDPEDHEFKASLGYIRRPCLKEQCNQKTDCWTVFLKTGPIICCIEQTLQIQRHKQDKRTKKDTLHIYLKRGVVAIPLSLKIDFMLKKKGTLNNTESFH